MEYINIIVAYSKNRIIGNENKLIWHLPADLKRFKELTSGRTVIMGRKTFDSIGKPLKDRENIVITRNTELEIDGCIMASSLKEAIELSTREIFIIGGEQIYQQALDISNRVYVTMINQKFEGDAKFPELDKSWIKLSRIDNKSDEKNLYDYSYITYEKATF